LPNERAFSKYLFIKIGKRFPVFISFRVIGTLSNSFCYKKCLNEAKLKYKEDEMQQM
jgi:hypothetical protein